MSFHETSSGVPRTGTREPDGQSAASSPAPEPSTTCPHCGGTGTIIEKGSMWWQDQHYRCSYCNGHGKIKSNPEGTA